MAALAEDLTGARLGLRLPAGNIVDDVDGNPVLWLSSELPERRLLDDLHASATLTKLWPVALNLEGFTQPVRSDERSSPVDAEAILADWSATRRLRGEDHDYAGCEQCLALIEHSRSQPAATIARESDQDPGRTAAEVASHLLFFAPRLGLVACDRSADIPARLGWDGPANYQRDISDHSAVLGKWEDQFGARVVALHGASLVCSVAAPPRAYEQARRLAAEQLAFCPDLAGEFESVNAHAAALVGVSLWTFWWD
jgi:hypothetical protein